MAEAFNCPKCGAPLSYNVEEQNKQDSITCSYCGETVIVPEALRQPASGQVYKIQDTSQAAVITFTTLSEQTFPPVVAARKPHRLLGGCLAAVILIGAVIAIVTFLSINRAKDALQQSIRGLEPFTVNTPVVYPTSPADAVQTQIAPLVEEVTKAVGEVKNKVLLTPSPEFDLTATAAVETKATQAALSAVLKSQQNWPVVLQEKFVNDQRNWTTGKDNNDLAVEDLSISANKYTWKMTSKKSMGSFSFPDMPTLTDLLISADVQMTAGSGNTSDQVGIIFHHSQSDKTFYFFGVNPDGTYSLRMYDGSGWNDLIPLAETSLLKPKQVNHLAVSMQGSQILLVINNTLVDSYEDSNLSEGTAGLGLNLAAPGEDITVIFTNFSVRAPKK